MTRNHFLHKCKHGHIVAQCRCPIPVRDDVVVACPPWCKEQYHAQHNRHSNYLTEPPAGEAVGSLAHERAEVDELRRRLARILAYHPELGDLAIGNKPAGGGS